VERERRGYSRRAVERGPACALCLWRWCLEFVVLGGLVVVATTPGMIINARPPALERRGFVELSLKGRLGQRHTRQDETRHVFSLLTIPPYIYGRERMYLEAV
jgi:hypothetical protein